MWEMTSGVPAFHNIPHDLNLSLKICKGIRPDNDLEKRPTAHELE